MTDLYFDIFETDTHLEYHVSAVKREILDRNSMSRRITKNNPRAGIAVLRWFNEAEGHACIRIRSHV